MRTLQLILTSLLCVLVLSQMYALDLQRNELARREFTINLYQETIDGPHLASNLLALRQWWRNTSAL